MARTRSENYDEIQRNILTTACGLFARQGYMRASIADLADACKLSRGALYHYFDSKEAILFAILDAHIREMIADVEAAMAEKATTLEQFRAAIQAIVALNARSSDEQRVILNDLSFLGETEQDAIKALERQLVDTVSDLLVKLDKEGKIVKRTKKIYSMMLFGILNFSHTWYDPKGGIDPTEFADMVVDLFLYGFTMPVPAKDAARALRQRA
ncbi:AcrR family transcriptional regulator [Bradyrhizobium sp. USDA 4518]|uniref:TetR/AcrR family transcriptional regulator n=1 Tax=Bradyrhizobium TaxID=374 RepID=UPI001E41843A|nr:MULTISPECIES: TetR/AcrR family transcriptional regulator [Bradyrhizobium]MCC8947139.1 TetR/AcrR family transcriptional regulator [Bradyrhizobium brasilense]MCP1835062.1 AcrR family transcriptional regulator [Bradyrhizobium sp. USDA 4545]MCP1919807.1 AcrR family transcriptional regulator [Bradyrhizobium sp. USDA 4532]